MAITGGIEQVPFDTGAGYNYWDVFAQVSDYLGTMRSPVAGEDIERVRDIIQSGYEQFLTPPPLPDSRQQAHRWTFLDPSMQLALTAGTYLYDLPPDFGGLHGSRFTYGSAAYREPVWVVSESDLMNLRANSDRSGDPQYAALRPNRRASRQGQTFEVLFWPTPDTAKVLFYRYYVQAGTLWNPLCEGTAILAQVGAETDYRGLQDDSAEFTNEEIEVDDKVLLTDATGPVEGIYKVQEVTSDTVIAMDEGHSGTYTTEYAILPRIIRFAGGQLHSETILQSCLAVAESRKEDTIGPQNQRWMERLRASISRDRVNGPAFGGYMGDASDGGARDSRMHNPVNYVTE